MATTKPRKATATPTPAAAAAAAPSLAPAVVGLPRWLLIVGALVPVGGLAWGVVTHFVPRVELPKPPAPVAVAAPVPSVSVSGSGNVGVGVMSGGTINNGGGGTKP